MITRSAFDEKFNDFRNKMLGKLPFETFSTIIDRNLAEMHLTGNDGEEVNAGVTIFIDHKFFDPDVKEYDDKDIIEPFVEFAASVYCYAAVNYKKWIGYQNKLFNEFGIDEQNHSDDAETGLRWGRKIASDYISTNFR